MQLLAGQGFVIVACVQKCVDSSVAAIGEGEVRPARMADSDSEILHISCGKTT